MIGWLEILFYRPCGNPTRRWYQRLLYPTRGRGPRAHTGYGYGTGTGTVPGNTLGLEETLLYVTFDTHFKIFCPVRHDHAFALAGLCHGNS